MEEAPENGKESSHSAHGNGMNARVGGTNGLIRVWKFDVIKTV